MRGSSAEGYFWPSALATASVHPNSPVARVPTHTPTPLLGSTGCVFAGGSFVGCIFVFGDFNISLWFNGDEGISDLR